MHTPRGEAQKARVALQSIYDRYLRHICGVKYAMPSAMLLEELGLSRLQVFWWRRTLEFWNKIAASPVGPLFHTILLDNLDDDFSVGSGAKNFSGSIAACLQYVEALRQHLGGTHDYVVKGNGRCCQGNYRAHMRIPDATTTPPSKHVRPRAFSQRTQPDWSMFDWEKYSFTAQRKVKIELATLEFFRSGALTGKVKRPASESETNCSKREWPLLSRELQSPYAHPRRYRLCPALSQSSPFCWGCCMYIPPLV